MFGRRSFAFFDFRANYIQLISNRNRREDLFFFVRFCRTTLPYKGFPTFLQNSFSLSRKHRAAAIQFHNALSVSVRISHSHTQTICNQLQNCKFTFWKLLKIAFLQFSCGNNGVMIRDFFVIHNLLPMNRNMIHTFNRECVENHVYKVGNAVFHIICQESTVRTRICDQLLFIQILRIIQCLLSRISKNAVCISLQAGQIIECRWLFTFFLTFRLCDCCHSAIAAYRFCFGLLLITLT